MKPGRGRVSQERDRQLCFPRRVVPGPLGGVGSPEPALETRGGANPSAGPGDD